VLLFGSVVFSSNQGLLFFLDLDEVPSYICNAQLIQTSG
jgi:hypothetical protein